MDDLQPKILIVDDETRNLYAIRRIIEPLPLEIIEAQSGEEALHKVVQHEFFMILMDVQMAGMNGFETASLILENPKTAHIPIIFITAISREEKFALKGYQSGAVDYIYKPVAPEILQAKINVFRELWVRRQELQTSNMLLAKANKQLKASSAALMNANASLQLEIAERLRVETELRQARLDADTANRVKSEFLANMSHEIRTPMNSVLGMLELLQDMTLNDKQRRYVDTAQDSAKSLLVLINDILDFSKIEAGRLKLEHIAFDLPKLVEDTVNCLARHAVEKGLELNCRLDKNIPTTIMGDPVRLRQVLSNLLSNAIKFTEHGEVDVYVNTEYEINNQISLRFEVKDSGIGIEPSKQAGLFDAFSQADSSITRKFGGTGLGLSISKKLMELMAGEIGVNSQDKQGATFWFRALFDKSEQKSQSKATNEQCDIKILVVDDNATNREIISYYLKGWDFYHGLAEDGPAALLQLTKAVRNGQPFDVVILDYHMPVMNGLELANKIKAEPNLGNPRIILLSSVGDCDKLVQAVGVQRHLVKPVRKIDLYQALNDNFLLVDDNSVSEDLPASQLASKPALPTWRTHAKILLVDDMKTNQFVAKEMLEKLGVSVELANDGEQAVAAITNKNFDLVLMDCQMPIMNGYAATEIIRVMEKAQKMPRLPIIAMTANAMQGDRDACFAAGMDDYISKPFKLDNLKTALTKWLPIDQVVLTANQSNDVAFNEKGLNPVNAG